MKYRAFFPFILGLTGAVLAASQAQAATICTAMADAKTGAVLLQEGNCIDRVTPASTFKIALSLMGYDAGFLKDEHQPTLPTARAMWIGAATRGARIRTRRAGCSIPSSGIRSRSRRRAPGH